MKEMPVALDPKERPIVRMLLSACDSGTWRDASFNWVEESQDAAVEVIATRADGKTLALEHTLLEAFLGGRFDDHVFVTAFLCIESNPALVLPERMLKVIVPVRAIPKGYDRNDVGIDLLEWLVGHNMDFPKSGELRRVVPVCHGSKGGPFGLSIEIRTERLEGLPGSCIVARATIPSEINEVVGRALRRKLPKLVNTQADKRILLLELDQLLSERAVYEEIERAAQLQPGPEMVHEIWFADTTGAAHGEVVFRLHDSRGFVEGLTFRNGFLRGRRDDRPDLAR